MEPGLSVVVTTWNGARRLPATLAALLAQRTIPEVRWEVIVVDNASTDGSAEVARSSWPGDAAAPLRVVAERQPGVRHANHRGLAEARFALIALVNDDNRPEPDWLLRGVSFMAAHPEAGAVGARGIALHERTPPAWFEDFRWHYAVGEQAETPGPLQGPRRALWGATSIYRVSAWRELLARGFTPHDIGRRGPALSAGEDYELGYALRLCGWQLWYEPSLAFQHFIPAAKLDWRWHRRMHRGYGASIAHDAYVRALGDDPATATQHAGGAWAREAAVASALLLRFSGHFVLGNWLAGDPAVVRADQLFGRLRALLAWRSGYDRWLASIRTAPWRRPASGTSSAA